MRLLLAVDIDTPHSLALVNEAVLWAQRTGATLDLAHVGAAGWALGTAADPEVRRLIEREVEKVHAAEAARLEELLERVPREYRGTCSLLHGDPVQVLVDASAQHAALLVGTHGRQGLRRVWLGSVSEQLVRRATCPVLVLRMAESGS